MRNLKINQRKYVALKYAGEQDVYDEHGFKTGETKVVYGNEIEFEAHISGATGSSYIDSNGVSVEYDKSFVLTKYELEKYGFDENTVFFIDKKPEYDGNYQPLYDYRVKRIKDTVNEVVVLLKKVRNE